MHPKFFSYHWVSGEPREIPVQGEDTIGFYTHTPRLSATESSISLHLTVSESKHTKSDFTSFYHKDDNYEALSHNTNRDRIARYLFMM